MADAKEQMAVALHAYMQACIRAKNPSCLPDLAEDELRAAYMASGIPAVDFDTWCEYMEVDVKGWVDEANEAQTQTFLTAVKSAPSKAVQVAHFEPGEEHDPEVSAKKRVDEDLKDMKDNSASHADEEALDTFLGQKRVEEDMGQDEEAEDEVNQSDDPSDGDAA